MLNVKRDMLVSAPLYRRVNKSWVVNLTNGEKLMINKFRLVACPDVLFYYDDDGSVSVYKSTLRKYDEDSVWRYFKKMLGFENSVPLVYNSAKNRMETTAFKSTW